MCLSVPGKVVSIDGMVAMVDFFGVRRSVLLHLVDAPVEPGDYVLNHVGYAISRIPPAEAEATLALYRELLSAEDGDLMAEDVRGELAAAGAEDPA